ncbi:unnamed protein product [Rhizophagus irregularis]|nr:unnamed protein product [Rhizophagus irregularis]
MVACVKNTRLGEKLAGSEALLFWKNVKNINAEFDLIELGSCKRDPELIQTLECLFEISSMGGKTGYLGKTIEDFQIECNESDQLLRYYWNLIKELSDTEDLIRRISNHNIENLYYVTDDLSNGISDQYIIILPFIQVKQALYPLINKHSVMNADYFYERIIDYYRKESCIIGTILYCAIKAFLITMDYINNFIEFVDNIQKIVEILTKLMQRGHFDYQKFETKIKGVENMKEFLISLNNDLEKMSKKIVYHLTFFTAHHIFAFYNYFTSEVYDEKNKDVCKTLIKFVNSNAQLPSHRKVEKISCDSYDYFSKIGTKLENIFKNIPKQRRKIKIIQQQVIVDDDITSGSFVVVYDNKSLVPNIIMSLYVNNGYYPESWQLLLCTSSTTMEELTIFTKRCFCASGNGYNNNLFCIVNLELLNFELQYSLVNHIKEMQLKNSNKNYLLALLCHRGLGMSQYILDQHTLDVREISGLNTEMMQEIYQELCPNVLCVTSDLSGQGKTEWIKESSFSKQKILHSFLISDDMSFEYLMNKLKECKLKEIESLHITILPIDYPETSSVKQNCLPMLRFLPSKHLSWNIEKFKASQEIFNPLQIVCHYLKLNDYRKVDKKEILFNTSDVIKHPISTELCQNLIIRYFFNGEIISSFRTIEIFINVLADQLIRLSSNDYFTINNLESNVGEESNIRSIIVKSLIKVSKDFATKFKADQHISVIDDKSVHFDIISQWNNLNNINIMFFNPLESNSFTILYQDKDKIHNSIKLLLNSQAISGAMDDYNTMFTNEFLTRLEGITCKSSTQKSEYVLSSDNLIKIALILLRVNANIPVVICGEAGCGKTSLIVHLALMIKVQYQFLNLYDGIEEETIMKFMSEALNKSEKEGVWLLFDEINTCNHLGLLADLISNRMFQGKPISSNIRLFATCNPYRPRVQNEDGRVKNVKKYKERGDLIYQVKPLPEQISDYVWNYDVLKSKDEYRYIQIMVKNELKELAQPVLVELIFASQEFIRKVEEPYSVSLRDVKRVITLVKFFYNSLNNRPAYKIEHKYPSDENHALIYRSYVLALSICYHSRLCEQDLRKQYCYEIGQIFQTHKNFMGEKIFIKIIREEQEDYINRMQIPNNVVKNEALLENILVMTVCILTKIPIFVIGETGSSKSLALRLISSNLRGSESNDDYFKSLPKVHIFPYLCSSSSTTDGITKVFGKANKFQETNSDVINVVLLDHVGFAVSNSSNPLKLLHTLLEPIYPATGPTLSFVGLSNWHLDISKSSRAIVLVRRPNFDLNDLVNINTKFIKFNQAEASKSLAEAYLEYKQHNQALPNFYGLQDYYALLKMLSLVKLTPENI